MSDFGYIFTWWAYIFVIGLVNVPFTWKIFSKFEDYGYGLSKVIGILLSSFIVFLLGIYKILPFSLNSIYVSIIALILFNLSIAYKEKKSLFTDLRKSLRTIVLQEILFAFGLIYWSYVRGHQPDIYGLEKFMDFGFINSILRSEYLPPADMWFAGNSINYYWFGHFMIAFLTKLSQIPSGITYNLMLATILGLSANAVFSLITTLIRHSGKINIKIAYIAGIISVILLNFAGNFHTAFFYSRQFVCVNYLTEACSEVSVTKDYWYPDATRFIGYDPDVEDKTIHEFPLYSYVVSDLHAHLINLPFVLLFLTLLYSYINSKVNIPLKHIAKEGKKSYNKIDLSRFFKSPEFRLRTYHLFILGFLLGVFFMTNAWDTANYLLASGFVLFFINIFKESKKNPRDLFAIYFNSFLITAGEMITIGSVAFITTIPFTTNFDSIAQGVAFVNSRSPLWQLSVLWGFPAILTIVFTGLFIKERKTLIKTPDIFAVALLATAWVLIVIPEIIYVKDIYIASHHRANTMFKLTYQAFVITYLLSGYTTIRSLYLIKSKLIAILTSVIFTISFALVLIYPQKAIYSYYGELEIYKGLQGDTWLSNQYHNEYQAILWFRENVKNQPTILEAQGDSYTDFNVISSYTGLPTVNGWYVHEWLWRGDSSFPQKRSDDIRQIYATEDAVLAKNLLDKYNVRYVVVGSLERQKYPTLNEGKFEEIGKVVFSSGNTNIYELY